MNNQLLHNEYEKNRRHNNPIVSLFSQAKARSKKYNLEFSITKNDIIIPELCPIFNIPLLVNDNFVKDNSYSIDRIDNTKGYIKNNIIIVSWKANKIKSQASIKEMELIYNYLRNDIVSNSIHYNSPSIDRYNNNLGYIKDNIRIISYRANVLKNNTSIKDYEKVYNFYKNMQE